MNYVKLLGEPDIKLYGFDSVKDFAYITLSQTKKTIIIEAKELPPRDNRFRVRVSKDRIISDEKLFSIARKLHLERMQFIYSRTLDNYYSTDIPAT